MKLTPEQRDWIMTRVEDMCWSDGQDEAVYIGDVEAVLNANTAEDEPKGRHRFTCKCSYCLSGKAEQDENDFARPTPAEDGSTRYKIAREVWEEYQVAEDIPYLSAASTAEQIKYILRDIFPKWLDKQEDK